MTESTGNSLTPEDARILAAAASDGRVSPDNLHVWCNAMRADREGTRRTLASITSIKADLYTAEQVRAKVSGKLGLAPEPKSSRAVAAAHEPTVIGGGATPPPAPAPRLDAVGPPLADVPTPVVIQRGTNPGDWTPRQRQDWALRQMGPRYFPGTQAPPAGDTVYWPSPNDVVRYDEASGTWVEKRPYKEV